MDDAIWSQIVVFFDRFFRHSVLFLVFTSIMNLFLQFPFKPTSKIRPKGPPALKPLALRAGFLRGVMTFFRHLLELTMIFVFLLLISVSICTAAPGCVQVGMSCSVKGISCCGDNVECRCNLFNTNCKVNKPLVNLDFQRENLIFVIANNAVSFYT